VTVLDAKASTPAAYLNPFPDFPPPSSQEFSFIFPSCPNPCPRHHRLTPPLPFLPVPSPLQVSLHHIRKLIFLPN
jgi:hypothetical protein